MNGQSSPTQLLRERIRGVLKMLITNGAILVAGAGILGNVWLYFISQINATQIAARQELSTYASYGKFLEKYRSDIEPAIGTFLNKKQYLSLEKDPQNLKSDGTYKNAEEYNKRCKHLLQTKTTTHTGFELFGLDEYKDYRNIHNFYETLGLPLSSGLISFETVFNMFILSSILGERRGVGFG